MTEEQGEILFWKVMTFMLTFVLVVMIVAARFPKNKLTCGSDIKVVRIKFKVGEK